MLALFRDAEDEVSLLIDGVVWIANRGRLIIVKDFRRLEEADAVFLLVLASFFGVPFEYQHGGSDGNLTFAISSHVSAA